MTILVEQVFAVTVSESASVSQDRIWLGHASAAEVSMWHFGLLNGDAFLYLCPALWLASQGPHVSADSDLESALHSPQGQE